MWHACILFLVSIALLCSAQRPPPPFENEPARFFVAAEITFPRSQDVSISSSQETEEKNWYSIRNFRFHQAQGIPQPKHRQRGPAPSPGDPFPPPPGGLRGRKKQKPNQQQRRLCERKYSEYVERVFPNDPAVIDDANDEDFDGRILAQPGEYPHMVAVGYETNTQQIEYKCGGSLISENFVLTAAHCTANDGISPRWARIGDLNLKVRPTQQIPIGAIYNHPDYKADLYYNDIALLQLEQNVILTEFVRPIRLWVRPELPTTIVFAMGYGATSFAKGMTNRLTDLNLTIVPNDECNQELPLLSEAPSGIIQSQICGQDYILNRDTCQGDSGGPLQLNLQGLKSRQKIHYHLIGITSYGVFCRSSYPSVYTRVASYLDWIEGVVWNGS
ncbi:serine protease snake [Scaptodrosophila lebanonensis]|uniref:Serine protease snake n=1 Tax=Drosophila lebanonensis TaxID=7225 RepID=A0A6J2T665_DROLE|nr:serine protease snake [Scaptodrosophila lebanonensis]